MLHGAQRTAAVNSGVEHLQRVIGDQVRAVHVHMNHQKRSKFEPDEGKAVEISIDAKLDPRIFHPNMNCQKVLSLITGRLDGESADTLTTEYFRMRHDALRAVAEQHFSAARRTTIDPLTGYDSAPWTCVLGEGSRIEVCRAEVPGREFGLYVGESVEFRFLSSSTRKGDRVGDLIEEVSEGSGVDELAPVETVLPAGAGEPPGTLVPVRLTSHVSEVGVLELWCVSRDGKRRWKLEYNIRERARDEAGAALAGADESQASVDYSDDDELEIEIVGQE